MILTYPDWKKENAIVDSLHINFYSAYQAYVETMKEKEIKPKALTTFKVEVPEEVIKAERIITEYFNSLNLKDWKFGGIQRRQ